MLEKIFFWYYLLSQTKRQMLEYFLLKILHMLNVFFVHIFTMNKNNNNNNKEFNF